MTSRFCEEDLVTNEIRWFLCFLTWARNYSILFNNKKIPLIYLYICMKELSFFIFMATMHIFVWFVIYFCIREIRPHTAMRTFVVNNLEWLNVSVWWDVLNDKHENWNQQINKLKNKTKHNTIKQKDHQQQQQKTKQNQTNKQAKKTNKQKVAVIIILNESKSRHLGKC